MNSFHEALTAPRPHLLHRCSRGAFLCQWTLLLWAAECESPDASCSDQRRIRERRASADRSAGPDLQLVIHMLGRKGCTCSATCSRPWKGTPCQPPLQPAALAPSVHCSPHAFSLTWYCALLSFVHILQVSCICLTVLTSAGAFERSENQEWPLDGVSGLRCSAGPFVVRDVCALSILLQRTCRLDSTGMCVH